MFTGIIECIGEVTDIESKGLNLDFTIRSAISHDLKVDQSVSHNGVCLTVIDVQDAHHKVTAVQETLERSSLGIWKKGTKMNLERCLQVGGRLDGHMVQGHVDTKGTCIYRDELEGSWMYRFSFPTQYSDLIVPKGSITVDGVSLTVVNPSTTEFEVAIIPYTFQHTNFQYIQIGDLVNLEFDILGKYIIQYLKRTAPSIKE